MSTDESKRNSSQAKPQSSMPSNSTKPQAKHSANNRRPLPFDDDDTGGEGGMTETTDPQQKQNIDREF